MSICQGSIQAYFPQKQLLRGSLCVEPHNRFLKFEQWSKQNLKDSYAVMQKIVQQWQDNNITDQYLIIGKANQTTSFSWEIVPYERCSTWIGRVVQQIVVLWRFVFGGAVFSEQSKPEKKTVTPLLEKRLDKAKDPFCDQATIDRQCVLYGDTANVLYNIAPIGFGGEKLHFLIVPKRHCETFAELDESEYVESLQLAQQLYSHFRATRKKIENVYIFYKSGIDAGLTVPHPHMHFIVTTNPAQDVFGNLTVFKNIFFGSFRMNSTDFKNRVGELKKELSYLSKED